MNKIKILLVDDEEDILEFLTYDLKEEGFEVITASNGEEALSKLNKKPDLLVLDVNMPVMDGFEVCKRIRESKEYSNIPVIFLTARLSEIDELRGLNLGADDYIKKPISPRILIARIHSNLRKQHIEEEEENFHEEFTIGPLHIDRTQFQIRIDGRTEFFPKKEFEIITLLAANPNKVFTREEILKKVWGEDIFVVDRTVDVHVRKIREKLGDYSELIETIKGVGYKFKFDE